MVYLQKLDADGLVYIGNQLETVGFLTVSLGLFVVLILYLNRHKLRSYYNRSERDQFIHDQKMALMEHELNYYRNKDNQQKQKETEKKP